MFLRAIPVIALVTSLSACGGSSDGSAVNPVQPPSNAQVLRTFANGDGVARSVLTLDGEAQIANAIVGDVQGLVAAINQNGLTINSVTSEFLGDNGVASVYSGTSTVNGELIYVSEVYNNRGPSWIILGESATQSALIAGGARLSNVPAGSYVYTGTNAVGYRDGSKVEFGSFQMGVNFTNGTANISGTTDTSRVSGNMSVNSQSGTFSGNNMLLTEVGVAQVSGTMVGNFHGDGATAVSGVYYDNSPNPIVAGAIAGSR